MRSRGFAEFYNFSCKSSLRPCLPKYSEVDMEAIFQKFGQRQHSFCLSIQARCFLWPDLSYMLLLESTSYIITAHREPD